MLPLPLGVGRGEDRPAAKLDELVGEGKLVRLAVDEVGGESVELVRRRRLQETACEGDRGVGRDATGQAHEVSRLMVGLVGDGAGVDDNGVGLGCAVDHVPAGIAQATRHHLGIGDVELAAEGKDGGGGRMGGL